MVGKSSNKLDSNGWTWVFRNNKESQAKHIGNPFHKEVESVALSFYVTNFPDSVDARGLWNVCAPYGCLVDAYIANKRSNSCKRFGFIRFVGVKDDNAFARSLPNIWIGNYHVYVTVERFQRRSTGRTEVRNVPMRSEAIKPDNGASNETRSHPVKSSFASVVHRSHKSNGESSLNTNVSSPSLNEQDLIIVDDSSKVVLVKLKEVETMSSLYTICKNEGFTGLKIQHVAGLWVWIQFPTADACMAFKSNVCMKQITSYIKHVTPTFKVDERMIWVEISGLPLCAWGSNAFKKVASVFGKFMFFEVEQSTAMSTGRVCISTKSPNFLSEKVRIHIHGETFEVQVRELGTWNINIVDDYLDSSSNDDVNKSEKAPDSGDEESDDGMQDDNGNKNEKASDSDDEESVDGMENTLNNEAKAFDSDDEESVDGMENTLNNEAGVKEGEDCNVSGVKVPFVNSDECNAMNEGSTNCHPQPSNVEVLSDLSYPPGFEPLKMDNNCHSERDGSTNIKKCFTSFARYRKKDIKGISLIHEMSRMIEVAGTLDFDVRGCRKSLNRMINGIGVHMVEK
ncbi:hypothetical protein CTI12_AA364010 [Artemisia annua]|uniref:RRM domain-containing protein n=1 Tax=Artemisia annua TaxID=35608 RepID=A0A2U1MM68_ARTAN|nr:hypothetical protein CTI12_AA364010 [Artemisia annua]